MLTYADVCAAQSAMCSHCIIHRSRAPIEIIYLSSFVKQTLETPAEWPANRLCFVPTYGHG
eukprot:33974_6